MLECSWKVSNPFIHHVLLKLSVKFHLISFQMPRRQKTFVAVVLGTFPQKTAPQCAGSSVASVSTRFWVFWCSYFNLFFRSWKRSETKSWSQCAIARRTVCGKIRKKTIFENMSWQSWLKNWIHTYINLPASHIKIFWNRSRYTLSVQNRELRERLSSEYWVRIW